MGSFIAGYLEIKDKKGSENVVADHLSRLEHELSSEKKLEIAEFFPDEQLFSIQVQRPWYADIVNFLVGKFIPPEMTFH